jgi:ribosome-binding ATPase YchF (GTP1/OBG family)
MMRGLVLILAGTLALAWPTAPLHAQAANELDRLRAALRTLTAQVRGLEDQRAALQARMSESDRDKERLNQQVEGYKAQLKESQDAQQQAVDEFNKRLTERDETLEKWKAAYEEAATVARAKDAERARFESEATTYKARTGSCEAKNVRLLKISNQILAGYRDLNLGDVMAIREPLIGIRGVEHQNKVQNCGDRILDQDAKLPAEAPGAKPPNPEAKPAGAREPGKTQSKDGKDQKPNDRKAGNQKKDEKVNP